MKPHKNVQKYIAAGVSAALLSTGFCAVPQAAEENSDPIGSELAALGINVDFAPVLDVNNNPANPVIGVRSFSDVPEVAAESGAGSQKNAGFHRDERRVDPSQRGAERPDGPDRL